ncbi:MAG: hypothetical protein WBW49_05460 [Candidatus Acidiferrum sp.]
MYNLTTGVVTSIDYVPNGIGNGSMSGVMPSGEAFKGEYVTIAEGDQSWARFTAQFTRPIGRSSEAARASHLTAKYSSKGRPSQQVTKGWYCNASM